MGVPGSSNGFDRNEAAEPSPLPWALLALPAVELAPALIGATFLLDGVGGIIVETEAYTHDDPASHSFKGRTRRNAAMWGPPGNAYVYHSYGLHWCFNIVCGPEGSGSAVLIRALEPRSGLPIMVERRRATDPRLLCRGPGRLCQALAITGALDGRSLLAAPFTLLARPQPVLIATGPRIGITQAADRPWRFGLKGSAFLSRAFF